MSGLFNRKTVGGFFFAVLLLLIFFSKTIYAHNLPVVTATKPSNGRLSKLEYSSGVANWAEEEKLYAAVGGTVVEVLAKEGDTVSKGQELLRLSFDRDETERKLKELQNSRSKLLVDIENINMKLEKAERNIADLQAEEYELEEVSTYEMDVLEIDILKARAEVRDTREKYQEGNATDTELDRARYNLDSLYLKQDELEKKLAEQEEAARKTLADQEKARETKLLDYQQEIAGLKLDLQNKNTDLNNLSLQEEPYTKALSDFEAYAAITSPVEGTLVSLTPGKGERIQEAQLIASIAENGDFLVECTISLENNFVVPGDTCLLTNATHEIRASVTKLTPAASGKTVSLEFSSSEVAAGETFDVTFEKMSQTSYILVPNGALNQDNDGYFLNQVKRRNGILGKEYYLERLDVFIGDSDSKNTVIVNGIRFFEPVALVSNMPVGPGDIIQLENAGDFFER